MDVNQQNQLAKELIVKGFLYMDVNGVIFPTDKWASGWPKIEEEFEVFWKKDGKNCWTGSKKQGFILYSKVRKSVEKDTLLRQRDYYFDFLSATRKTGFNRAAMMIERWLNPKNEYYMEDYKQYIEDLKNRYPGIFKPTTTGQPQAQSLTKEDYKKDYEQNTNK